MIVKTPTLIAQNLTQQGGTFCFPYFFEYPKTFLFTLNAIIFQSLQSNFTLKSPLFFVVD